ncbi:hypothetical protein G6F57_001247 [Rhizopus arrhizus]|uniref:Uncharacterized protein n=1 Tax=Rhizopus oryzae TaxID=64495 RepID=A0A9P7BVI7_RHIOR|nr:hypothetical protein G6F30_002140 [Rhizopus arrhizus]KAG1415017.1 hypothetical protein G6F58_006678 [Rhizopus delemar]KAG0987671.1 hypothetical protein G6F29_002331 [Rhizopus arrhizus]KAG0998870.1 hypothetical protein G6F28_001546 [Rhizopus arrhizus]KAG1013442.1 hypothetical protein G6F27_001883 [Rhizopus arrhizus]
MEEELIQKVATLINELALQQQNNQQLALELSKQITEIKQKTSTTKLPFDDQSVSIPKPLLPEQRDEVIETLKNRLEKTLSEQQAAQQRNQELEKEKKNLQNLVKEYETSLETVTNKLRTYANAASEGQIQLRREYNALLEAEKGITTSLFMENIALQSQLSQLAKTLRIAHDAGSLDCHYEQKIAQLEQEKRDLLKISGLMSMKERQINEGSSAVLHVARTKGVLEEFFNE